MHRLSARQATFLVWLGLVSIIAIAVWGVGYKFSHNPVAGAIATSSVPFIIVAIWRADLRYEQAMEESVADEQWN